MDFPAPSPSGYTTYESDQRSWRRAAIVTAAIAAVELVVLLVIVLAFIAKPFADDAASSAKAQDSKSAGTLLPRAETPILVLNGNGVAGSAGATARKVRGLDYPVVDVADASRRNFARTIVMFRDGARPEAVRLAKDLGFTARRVVPLDGMRESELLGAEVALVVGRNR